MVDLIKQRSSIYDVIIIGAGASGLAAASRLTKNGHDSYLILEAKDRIGGRIQTTRFDDNIIELGAEFIHGDTGNVVFEAVKEYDIWAQGVLKYENTTPVDLNGKEYPSEHLLKMFEMSSMEELSAQNGSLRDFMLPQFEKYFETHRMSPEEREIYTDMVVKAVNNYEGGDISQVGARGRLEFWEFDVDDINWRYGYQQYLDILMGNFPSRVKSLGIEQRTLLNKHVTQIDWTTSPIKVTCSDSTTYRGKKVLITVSLGVLQNPPVGFFTPPLPPSKTRVIENLGFGLIAKVFVKFNDLSWFSKYKDGGVAMGASQSMANEFKSKFPHLKWALGISWIAQPYLTKNILYAWVQGDDAAAMENSSIEDVTEGVYQILKLVLQKEVSNLPRPTKLMRSMWGRDPHVRGSYSYRSVASDDRNVTAEQLGEPVLNSSGEPMLLFAGEATHPHYYSTVHGAVESGYREADRILRALNPSTPSTLSTPKPKL